MRGDDRIRIKVWSGNTRHRKRVLLSCQMAPAPTADFLAEPAECCPPLFRCAEEYDSLHASPVGYVRVIVRRWTRQRPKRHSDDGLRRSVVPSGRPYRAAAKICTRNKMVPIMCVLS
jgi:hypothetical protein